MLGSVSLAQRSVAEFAALIGDAAVAQLQRLAAPLRGRRVTNLTVTAFGTWHTDLLAASVPLLRDLGVDAEWSVVRPTHEAAQAVDTLYAALAGGSGRWDRELQQQWERFT